MISSYSKGRLDALVETPPPTIEEAMRPDNMLAYTGVPRVFCPWADGQLLPDLSLFDRYGLHP